jgi:hypothetical protein
MQAEGEALQEALPPQAQPPHLWLLAPLLEELPH